MIRSGGLTYHATIEKPTDSQDTIGGPTQEPWTTVFTCWGSIEPLSTRWREYWQGQRENAEVSGQFRTRYRAGVNPTMRINVDGRYLYIVVGPLDPDGKKREMLLFYRETQA